MGVKTTPRYLAFQLLERFERGSTFGLKSNILLNEALSSKQVKDWGSQDRGFFTQLVYGVLRQWFLLENILQSLSRFPVHKIEPNVRALIKLGLYQLRFMENVPDYAAVNSTLEVAKVLKLSQKTVSFINGLLRSYQRKVAEGPFPKIPNLNQDPLQHISLMYSLPQWFIEDLMKHYSLESIVEMAVILKQPAPLSLRVNTLKTTIENFHQSLKAEDIPFQVGEFPESILLEGFYGSPQQLPGYAEGYFVVQDLSSMAVAHWVDPQPGECVLDLCAAPGSKTTHMAAMMNNQGEILAIDNAPKRLERLQENLARLGGIQVKTFCGDAQDFTLPESEKVDRVLVDAPCSGLGTVRRHPEILMNRDPKTMAEYPIIQYQLLEKGFSLLKEGGILVYSTCSIQPKENYEVIRHLIKAYSGVKLLKEEQRLITPTSDGFYLAKLVKL